MILDFETSIDSSVIFLQTKSEVTSSIIPLIVQGSFCMNKSDALITLTKGLNYQVVDYHSTIKQLSKPSNEILEILYDKTFLWKDSLGTGLGLKQLKSKFYEFKVDTKVVELFKEHNISNGVVLEEVEFFFENDCKEVFNYLLTCNGMEEIPKDVYLNDYFNYNRLDLFTREFPDMDILFKKLNGKYIKISATTSPDRDALKFNKSIPFNDFIVKLELSNGRYQERRNWKEELPWYNKLSSKTPFGGILRF